MLKITVAFRILKSGLPYDAMEDYTSLSETTTLNALVRFGSAVIESLGRIDLQNPASDDVARLLWDNWAHEGHGMIGSLQCCN